MAAVVTAASLMTAVALYSVILAITRVVGAATLSAESIAEGTVLPAEAIDGVSSGTLTLEMLFVTQMYDGNNVPSSTAIWFAEQLRGFLVPYAVANAIDAAFVLALAVVVLLLCLRLVRGRPFVRHMTWALAIFAVVIATFGLASQLVRRAPFGIPELTVRTDLEQIMRSLQAPSLPSVIIDHSALYTPAAGPLPLDLTLLGVAVLIGLVAAAFAIGQRMQRDTEGLV